MRSPDKRIDLRLIAILASIVVQQSALLPPAKAQVESPKAVSLALLQARWVESKQSLLSDEEAGGGKNRYEIEANAIRKIFESEIGSDSKRQQAIVEELCTDESDFGRVAIQEMIDLLARCRNRELLVTLLANRCPERIGMYVSIEAELVIVRHDTIPNGVYVLCDAYKASRNSDAKDNLLLALSRSFKFAQIETDDHDQFVARCREWYDKNRNDYEPNLLYFQQYAVHDFSYDTVGLFCKKGMNEALIKTPTNRPPLPANR